MSEPVVEVKEGKLLGKVQSDSEGNSFYSFLGIPYAKPPLGELRFKAPQPPETWEGIRNATEEGSECFAKHYDGYSGSEDCLFLNVFTKEVSSLKLRPVMFWIHGGSFNSGSSTTKLYGPDFLLREDVVVVTINYRLGPLGFLALSDPDVGVPGNAAFKDMVMALKWVQNNIKQFTGDPNNVTIFGESAGAIAVHLMVLSPMAKGLFHKAIIQSGCATSSWAVTDKISSSLFAQKAGIYSNDDKVILKHLQQLSLEELGEAIDKVPDLHIIGRFFPYGPMVETNSNEPAFLPSDPTDIIKSGKYNRVPMIMGCVSREGMLMFSIIENGNFGLTHDTLLPGSLKLRVGSNLHTHAANKVKKFYFGDKDPYEDKDRIYKLFTDNYFLYEMHKNALEHLETNLHPIYIYRFLYDTELNFSKQMCNITDPGPSHADDCWYIFKTDFTEIETGSVEDIGVRRTVKLWANFAKYGKPTVDSKDPILPAEWLPISKSKFRVFDIGEELKLHDEHPETKALLFWEELHKINPYSSKL